MVKFTQIDMGVFLQLEIEGKRISLGELILLVIDKVDKANNVRFLSL